MGIKAFRHLKYIIIAFVLFVANYCYAQTSKSNDSYLESESVFTYTKPVTQDTSIAMRDHAIIK